MHYTPPLFQMLLNALALHRSQLKPRRDSRINALLLSRVKPVRFKVPLPKRKSDESKNYVSKVSTLTPSASGVSTVKSPKTPKTNDHEDKGL